MKYLSYLSTLALNKIIGFFTFNVNIPSKTIDKLTASTTPSMTPASGYWQNLFDLGMKHCYNAAASSAA